MEKYHITPDGPKPCVAKENCKYEEHCENIEEAKKLYDRKMKQEIGIFRNTKKENNNIAVLKDLIIIDNSEDIYEKEIYELRLRNCEEHPYKNSVSDLSTADNKRLLKKANVLGISLKEMQELVISSPVSWFSHMLPAVNKQNFQERTLQKYLQENLPKNNVIILPKSGKNAKYLVNGRIITDVVGKPKNKQGIPVKSLDLQIDSKIFIIAKYTKGAGGLQDEQFHDVIFTINEFRNNNDNYLIACLDGNYYSKKNKSGETKFDILNNFASKFGNHNIIIGDYHSVLKKSQDFLE